MACHHGVSPLQSRKTRHDWGAQVDVSHRTHQRAKVSLAWAVSVVPYKETA
jgi:hypothetical protein